MNILSIDPGCFESAYTIIDETLKPIEFGKIPNIELLTMCKDLSRSIKYELAVEMIASYGMAVGMEVFETVFWIGRFWEAFDGAKTKIFRKDEKMTLCYDMKANDSNIIQALADRFAYGIPNKGKGTVKAKGYFYGFNKDIWQAYAVGITYYDLYIKDNPQNQTTNPIPAASPKYLLEQAEWD